MPRRLPVDERRSELLRFGEKLFAEHPADAFSMAEIARRAGVSKALLYHYFGGRRGYYVATIEAIAEQVETAITPERGLPFEQAFERALVRYLAFVRDNGATYRALVKGGLGVDPEVAHVVERLRRTAMDFVLLRLGVDAPTEAVRVACYGWVCFAESACLEWLEWEAPDEAEMLQILVDGLAPVRAAIARTRGEA